MLSMVSVDFNVCQNILDFTDRYILRYSVYVYGWDCVYVYVKVSSLLMYVCVYVCG